MNSAKGAQANAPLLKVGMLGAGVVGGQVARLLVEQNSDLAARSGSQLELVAISVKDLKKPRPDLIHSGVSVTSDGASIVNDPQIDIIIEVMGGIEPARSLILQALKNGKSVVTANKALLAQHGAELYEAAADNGVDIYFEAAVAGEEFLFPAVLSHFKKSFTNAKSAPKPVFPSASASASTSPDLLASPTLEKSTV